MGQEAGGYRSQENRDREAGRMVREWRSGGNCRRYRVMPAIIWGSHTVRVSGSVEGERAREEGHAQ